MILVKNPNQKTKSQQSLYVLPPLARGTASVYHPHDGGSALGQLAFGFLVAWCGATAPFTVAAAIAAVTGLACLSWSAKRNTQAE